MTSPVYTVEPGTTGAVLAGILAISSAEDVLRLAFDEAQDHGVAVRVMAAGLTDADEDELSGIVQRWSGKYPDVAVTLSSRCVLDPAITLTAATRTCCLAVLAHPTDAYATALVRAVARRSGCPVRFV
ncbi:hypothetical protein ODJ79_46115 [Actinoplanes sp. KI2]|uniref:hypothetical protein n=1 Tax=Actinoplanes sp. KI2 TaxID=2983315 RepID=UPI0021D60516|nr:hypothetical protein [Actinoplanes sp. KI2]MCU7731133.1 hypothetical protein [Actinoplanes sp. KI2]